MGQKWHQGQEHLLHPSLLLPSPKGSGFLIQPPKPAAQEFSAWKGRDQKTCRGPPTPLSQPNNGTRKVGREDV